MLILDVVMLSEERMKTKKKEELEVLPQRRSTISLMLFNMKNQACPKMHSRTG